MTIARYADEIIRDPPDVALALRGARQRGARLVFITGAPRERDDGLWIARERCWSLREGGVMGDLEAALGGRSVGDAAWLTDLRAWFEHVRSRGIEPRGYAWRLLCVVEEQTKALLLAELHCGSAGIDGAPVASCCGVPRDESEPGWAHAAGCPLDTALRAVGLATAEARDAARRG